MRQEPVYPSPPRLAMEECDPLDSDPSCERCSLHKRAKSVCMRPEIYGDRSKGVLLVVGQGPGEMEDRQGRPNVGISGQYLREQLKQRGRDGELGWPGAVVFDNSVRCMPGATKITPAMVKACRPYIHSTIREALPSRILCLGASAIQSVIGRSFPPYSVPRGYDFYRWVTLSYTPVFMLPHPAAGLRNRFIRQRFEADLAWALSAQPERPPINAVALIVETVEDAEEAVADLRLAPTVTWDVETFGAPFDAEFTMLRLSIVPQDCRYAYVLEHDVLEHQPEVVRPILELLRTYPGGGQSVKLDCIAVQARYGVRIENTVFDTHLYRRVLDPDQLSRLEYAQAQIGMGGSKDVANEHRIKGRAELRKLANKDRKKPAVPKLFAWMTSPCVDRGRGLLDRVLGRVWDARDVKGFPVDRYTYAAIPDPELTRYNAKDSISTDMIRSLLEGRLSERQDLLRVWEEVDRPLHYAITQMQFNGIAASREAAQQLSNVMANKLVELRDALQEAGAPEDFNPQAPLQVGKLLFETLKLPSKGRTAKSGQHKTSADVLEKLDHPVARLVVAYRQAAHFKSQYADGMQVFIQDDGRVHASFKIGGTESGRPSCVHGDTLIQIGVHWGSDKTWVPISQVQKGNLVFTHRRRWSEVTTTMVSAADDMYDITLSNGYVLRCTMYHRMLTWDHRWVTLQEILDERFEEVDIGVWERRTCARAIPEYTMSYSGEDRTRAADDVPECATRCEVSSTCGGVPCAQGSSLLPRQDGQEQSHVGAQGGTASQLEGRVCGRPWLLDHASQRQETVRSPGCDGGCVGSRRDTISSDSSPHRRGFEEQRARQSCSMHEQGSSDSSFLAGSPNGAGVSVERAAFAGRYPVYDITVAADESYEACGIFCHNCEDPNLLNIPKAHTPEGKLCRDIFVAPTPKPGQASYVKLILTVYDSVLLEVFDGVSCWIVELDYSQMELRVAAMLSGDERMIQVFKDGKDLHLETARFPLICSVFKVDPSSVDKNHPLRSRCKAVVFGTLYGQPPEALAALLGISKKQAIALQNAILGAYPQLRGFIQERRQFGMRHGYCRTWWNGGDFRQRPLLDIGGQDGPAKDTAIRATWNTPVQGTAAEYTNASLGRIQPWLDGVNRSLATGSYDAPMAILPDVVDGVRSIMEGWPVMHDVPIKVDVKVGTSWGSMEDYDG